MDFLDKESAYTFKYRNFQVYKKDYLTYVSMFVCVIILHIV